MSSFSPHALVNLAEDYSAEVLRPAAAQFDQDGGVSKSVIAEMAKIGLLGAALPVEFGGSGVDPLSYGLITEAVGVGCSNTRALLTVHTSLVGETVAKLASSEIKNHYLPLITGGDKIAAFALSESKAGSDAASIQTSFEETATGYRINGHKKWITYGAVADLFLVFASNNGVVNAFIVDRDFAGVKTTPMQGLMASRGAHLAHIEFSNVEVPKANLIGRPGMGFAFVANTALFYGRFSIAWAGVAIARAAVEEMVTYARSREQFSTKLSKHQLVQALIADSVSGLYSAKAMCERISRLRQENDEQAIMETNIAKLHTSRIAKAAADNAVQVLGGNGLWNEYAVERLYREARVLEIIEGSTQIQQMMIANYGLRKYFKPDLKKNYPA
ncbi:acyl-CoA dehydrogenase family protein [Saccharophagus degradans]|uniref:Acyl-CoA dehydrogenase family protein n=1 Tax=Saccharophagus degradans TaxID=86304 RepID=A0AAW7X3N2_9GAMM|nr:acyl-CoA dehydrogenase family protein [Saccharophagus degradans]MBU2985631.1 acyl-CoA dehydrogenase family protein [Saccharophagus degradans]MDO6421231.1 acyl-CoA dehydrogenase family protein [Saccharophagus degradans]MDO6605858.1 acyl-CoA dehydrogenase family protein [Saccharophagus degradans]